MYPFANGTFSKPSDCRADKEIKRDLQASGPTAQNKLVLIVPLGWYFINPQHENGW
jgi:hypothetical protein